MKQCHWQGEVVCRQEDVGRQGKKFCRQREDLQRKRGNKTVFAGLLAAVCAAVLLAGCSQSEAPSEAVPTKSVEAGVTSEPEAAKAPSLEEEMIQKSLMSEGNNARVKKVLEKARAGEDVTIAFLGGSITEGYKAGTKEIYAKRVCDYIAAAYGTEGHVHYVNAGLSGTPSILGLIRSDRDVFAEKPDLLFIEFAVNDGQSSIDDTGLESLIVKALKQDTAVILLYSVTREGYTCQNNMNALAFAYGIPCISVKNAIWEYIENGQFAWDSWSGDEAHPNAGGHELYAKFIINLLQTLDQAEPDEPKALPERFVKGFDHSALKMVDRSMNTELLTALSLGNFQETGDLNSFHQGWTYTGDAGTEAFSCTFTGKALYVVYKDTKDPLYGTAEVYVDGEYVLSLCGNSEDGWGNPVTERILRKNDSAEHTLEIRMKAGEEHKRFAILALGIVE